ncbi:MAG: type II toxin-antitoxin system RelE/ParE family toxin [Allomuricauda sp.]
MKSGYKILWSDHALSELKETIEYLEEKWSDKEIKNFARELDHTIELISKNPELFQASKNKKAVRRAVILKLNSLYYRKQDDVIEILSFFSNRKKPDNLNL